MASHHLIEAHLDGLAAQLPADAIDELADGLLETWHHHLDHGLTPTQAAHAAIAEFGTPNQITDAFVTHAPGRRIARTLLATGPIFGACWGTSLLAAHAWTWPIPATVAAAYAITLIAVVACLIAAATSTHNYRRTHLGDIGATGLVALDIAMLAAVLLIAPTLVWPMAIAIPASLTRVAVTLRHLPRAVAG